MININFWEAKETDLNKLLDIYNFYLRNTTATFDYDEIDMDEFRSRISFQHGSCKTYLIKAQGKLAGFCFLTQFKNKPAFDRTAEIGIYLSPAFTRKGIGKAAVEFLENYARGTGIKVIISNISGENEASIKLFAEMNYIKCGHFREIGEKFGRILDVVYYQKIL